MPAPAPDDREARIRRAQHLLARVDLLVTHVNRLLARAAYLLDDAETTPRAVSSRRDEPSDTSLS